MRVYPATKKVLSVTPHPEKFLNGLTTNSLDQPRNAFVSIHGRIIATFDQLKVSDEKFLLVLESAFVATVLDHVDRYAKLSQVKISEENFNIYFDLDSGYKSAAGEYVILQSKGQLILTSKALSATVSDEEFKLFRLKNNIPLLGVDYRDEMLLNVSETEFVSFTKGCFLGQEPIAKVHHRSKPTWKLVVKSEDECSAEEKAKMTSKTTDPASGRTLGFVFTANT